MTDHLSTEIVERLHLQQMGNEDRHVIYDHVLACESCRQRIVDAPGEGVALQTLSDHLLPYSDHEHYHLDYELIEGYVDNKLDAVDRSMAEMHLEVCAECSAEVTDLRESLATMKAASVQQHGRKTTLRERLLGLTQLPAFSPRVFAILAVAVFAVIAAVVLWRLKSGGPTQAPIREGNLSAGSNTTPVPPPQVPKNASTPVPSLGPNPYKLAESNPNKRATEPRQKVLALNDGPSKVTLENSGKLVGMESLPRESQQAVKEALTAETIKKPEVLDGLTGAEISLRGPTGNEEPVRVVYPANTVIAEDRPLFEWLPSKTANAYRVEVGDAGFHQVAKSGDLPPTTRAWTSSTPLKRGMVYTWVVREIKKGTEEVSPSAASQGRFKVLEEDKVKDLGRLKAASQSHLALGVFYAREGMIAEAQREFQILVHENPRSSVVRKLLKQVQSWDKH